MFGRNSPFFVLRIDWGPHSSYEEENRDPRVDCYKAEKIGPTEAHNSEDFEDN